MFILTYLLKLIAESIGIEPNSELTERSRLAVCPYHHQGLLSIQTINVYAIHYSKIIINYEGSNNGIEPLYREPQSLVLPLDELLHIPHVH